MKHVSTGIDHLAKTLRRSRRKTRTAVLCHPSSVDKSLKHLISIADENSDLRALFGPQHGIHCQTQDNMIEWEGGRDSKGRPVYSLYGKTRVPEDSWLKDIELVIIDLFDIGSRVYTYQYTTSYMLEVCGRLNIPVIICDRPNPLGGQMIEGDLLDPHYASFVGRYPMPVRPGLTLGELAKYFSQQMKNPPKLEILKCTGWKRGMEFDETGLTWLMPSPNMPNFLAARLFPGMVYLEGCTLSEGRGTTRPFELVGAPFFDWDEIEKVYLEECKKLKLLPVQFHRQDFIPTFHKYSGQHCTGAIQVPPKSKKFQPYRHGILMFWIWRKLYANSWSWTKGPYEYEYDRLPIDMIAGGEEFRKTVDEQRPLKEVFKKWEADEKAFAKTRRPFLLYS